MIFHSAQPEKEEYLGMEDAKTQEKWKSLIEALETENWELKQEKELYKAKYFELKSQKKGVNSDSIRIEELEFERKYSMIKIQNLEKDL